MADQEFDDDFEFDLPPVSSQSQPAAQYRSTLNSSNDNGQPLPHKNWTTLYPIYFDAKRKFGGGQRRINYEKSSLFPQSLHIAQVADKMGWKLVHEVHKTHPQDWENPGRVKICMDDLVNGISTKRALINSLALGIQSFSGKPPPLPKVLSKKEKKEIEAQKSQEAESKAKAKAQGQGQGQGQDPTSNSKTKTKSANDNDQAKKRRNRKRQEKGPKNPVLARNKLIDYPDVKDRLPPHSPAQEGGIISTPDPNHSIGMGAPPNPMGMMGGMLSAMMGGDDDDDDDDEENGKGKKEETEEERKKREWEELQRKEREKYGMGGRRGRKKMVRVGR